MCTYVYSYHKYLHDPRGFLPVAVPDGALDEVAPHVLHHVRHVHHVSGVLRIGPRNLRRRVATHGVTHGVTPGVTPCNTFYIPCYRVYSHEQ